MLRAIAEGHLAELEGQILPVCEEDILNRNIQDETFDDADKALAYLENAKYPIVLKADGLALGKGVLICNSFEEAKAGVKEIMLDKKFGTAGNRMVIEEYMTGREVSVLTFTDGKTIKVMSSAQDHKRAGDGDTGLNTGGMGTFSPSPFYTAKIDEYCRKNIYKPTVEAMAAEDGGRTVEFHVLGCDGTLDAAASPPLPGVVLHAASRREEWFARVRDIRPAFALVIPPQPTAWCHVLTRCWAAGLQPQFCIVPKMFAN